MTVRAAVSFGPFTVDVAGASLRRAGVKVPVRPKCFAVLIYLLERRGAVVSKEELLGRLWPDVVVSDGTLNRTVTELRALLADDADSPKYIETVSRRGYKFVAVLEEPRDAEAAADYALVHDRVEYPLGDGEHLIGRGTGVAIPIYASATSRHHARVVVAGGTITIEDLGSRNGTYVNGNRAAGVIALHAGDEIRIGSACLIVWSRGGETASLR